MARVVSVLAAYSLPIYLAGIAVIALPSVLAQGGGVTLSPVVRYVIVGGSLGVMVVTYLAERRVRRARSTVERDEKHPTASREYSLYARASIAAGAVGVALGGYVGIAMERPIVGALFVFGAYLFVRMGYRHEEHEREE